MCSLAATGAEGSFSLLLLAIGLVTIAAGVLLVRRSRVGLVLILIVIVAGGGIVAPPSAQAACPPSIPAAPPAPPAPAAATISLIVTDTEFRLTGPRNLTVDVTNTSMSATAFAVTLVGAAPAGVTFDDSPCAALAPGASCSILVAISAAATPFLWTYGVAGSNTNTVADSIQAWAETQLIMGPPAQQFTIPGDSYGFSVMNFGSVDARFMTLTFGGSDPGAYSIVANTCGATLAPGSVCTFTVNYGIPPGDGDAILQVGALNANQVTSILTS